MQMNLFRSVGCLLSACAACLIVTCLASGQDEAATQNEKEEEKPQANYRWTPDGGVEYIGPGEEPRKRNSRGFYSTAGAGYLVIPIPPPISPSDIERWVWMMRLSEAQGNFLVGLYEAYSREENDYHDREVQKLWQRSADLSSRREAGCDVAWATEVAVFYRKTAPGRGTVWPRSRAGCSTGSSRS
jgi:hypothetical protein